MKTICIIPARYGSTRLPGKPMIKIHGVPMIRRVFEQALTCFPKEHIFIATDSQEVVNEMKGEVEIITSTTQFACGTDRCAAAFELIRRNKPYQNVTHVINLQCDIPFISVYHLSTLKDLMYIHRTKTIYSLIYPILSMAEVFDKDTIKVVYNMYGEALYFSRQVIPYNIGPLKTGEYHGHIGVYGFEAKTLLEVAELQQTRLEKIESLEQLRWLENGYSIRVARVPFVKSINSPKDIEVCK